MVSSQYTSYTTIFLCQHLPLMVFILPSQSSRLIAKVQYTYSFSIATHTHTSDILPGEPGLITCSLDSPAPFVLNLCILLGQTKIHHILFTLTLSQYNPTMFFLDRRREQWEGREVKERSNWCRVFVAGCSFCCQPVLKTFPRPHPFFSPQTLFYVGSSLLIFQHYTAKKTICREKVFDSTFSLRLTHKHTLYTVLSKV